MTARKQPPYAPLRVDTENEWVWCGEHRLKLTPKTFVVLRYLVEHAGRLVTKDQLMSAVWPDTVVSEWALTSCLREIRKALADTPKAPQYIETVHRRGLRFIGSVASSQHSVASSPPQQLATDNRQLTTSLVGRETELAQLHQWLDKTLRGKRQIVFVTGEPGIGKTSLVEAFLQQAGGNEEIWIGRGQCIEHFGAGEAYLPVLEALGRLCREPGHEQLIEVLHQYAPTWLVQMPALLNPTELETLQRKVQGTTRERMLREMAEALEALTAERALILWLEDLHWSDYSTLDLLTSLARRLEKVRLLVIGSYRPVDLIVREHPLKVIKEELQLHNHCQELALELLSEAAVAEYLALRLVAPSPAEAGEGRGEGLSRSSRQRLARLIHQRTEGNPLFMVTLVDERIAQGDLDLEGIGDQTPSTLRQLIERQVEQLSPAEQQVLTGASAAGMEFSAAAVAASREAEVTAVEMDCTRLARHGQFLRASGIREWHDATVAAGYEFLHALYQEVLYRRLSVSQLMQLHQRIGRRLEVAYGQRSREIAAELAVHFERGRKYGKAIQYLQQAGENATQRSAYQEAMSHLTKGLELLKTLPDTAERIQQELALQITLSDAVLPVKGYAAPEMEKTVTRARELYQQLGETPQLFPVLFRLFVFYHNRGEVQTARELAEQMMRLAQSAQDQLLLSLAHAALGATLSVRGELTSARPHLGQAIALYDPQKHLRSTVGIYFDPRVLCRSYAAWNLWSLGYLDEGLKRTHEAVTLAEGLSHPLTLTETLFFAAAFHSLRREWQIARERAEAAMTLATEQGFPYWMAWGRIMRGGALAEQGQMEESIAQMQQGLAALRAMGAEWTRIAHLPMLAAAYAKVGRVEEGLSVVAEVLAFVDKTGARVSEAGLYVLKGWLLLARSGENQAETEACFHKAIDIARRQSAKSLELRAVMSLSRLWQRQGKKKEARQLLAEIYGWFTEGFDTKDLQEAKALLAELS